jgi:hypothetical protein
MEADSQGEMWMKLTRHRIQWRALVLAGYTLGLYYMAIL